MPGVRCLLSALLMCMLCSVAKADGAICRWRQYLASVPVGGAGQDIAIRDTLAFVALGYEGLRVYDFSNPRVPSEVSAFDTGSALFFLAMAGDQIALSDGLRVYLLDVSDPTDLQPLGSLDLTGFAQIRDMEMRGSYLYIAGGTRGLVIVDIHDPSKPEVAWSSDYPNVDRVHLHDSIACAGFDGGLNDGIAFFDITDPFNPVRYPRYSEFSTVTCLDSLGDYLLVSDLEGVHVLNIFNLTSPTTIASLDTPRGVRHFEIVGDRVTMADPMIGLRVFDMADVTTPREVATFQAPYGETYSLGLVGDIAVLGGSAWIHFIDVSRDSMPSGLSDIKFGRLPFDVAAEGHFIYVATGTTGLYVLDATDSSNPVIVGHRRSWGSSKNVVCRDNRLYVADGDGGLVILDVSDPAAMVELGTLSTYWGFSGLHFVCDDLVVASSTRGLHLIDVTDPAHPALYSRIGTSFSDADASGDYLFMTTTGGGMHVYDISDRDSPVLARSLSIPGGVGRLSLHADTLFASNGQSGLVALDVSNPLYPTIVGELIGPTGFSSDLAIDPDTNLALLNIEGSLFAPGIRMVDVSDPTCMQYVGWYNAMPPRTHAQVALENGIGWSLGMDSANGATQLRSFDTSDCAPCQSDINGDGTLDRHDVEIWADLYQNGDLRADFCRDCALNVFDMISFLRSFSTGCS